MWVHDEYGLIRRNQVLDTGVLPRDLAAAVSGGRLVRVGRGVYIDGSLLRGKQDWAQRAIVYRSACLAAATRADTGRVLSHDSAAVVHGLAQLFPDRRIVHFTNRKASGGCRGKRVAVVHPGAVPDDDVAVVSGVQVTSLARTAVDVALAGDFKAALAVFDAALQRGVDRDDLAERLTAPRRGVRTARYALREADPLAANPGESWCRAQMILAHFPSPVPQREYVLRGGGIAKVDFDFEGKVVAEFDGITKYSGEYLGPGQTAADVVVAEKLREDRLRELGLVVVRGVWADLRNGTFLPELGRRLRAHGIAAPEVS